jgi:hypothetical protein
MFQTVILTRIFTDKVPTLDEKRTMSETVNTGIRKQLVNKKIFDPNTISILGAEVSIPRTDISFNTF